MEIITSYRFKMEGEPEDKLLLSQYDDGTLGILGQSFSVVVTKVQAADIAAKILMALGESCLKP